MSRAALRVVPFTLCARSCCRLCEDMLQAWLALQGSGERFEVAVIDVDADPALVARFDELVPVLYGDPSGAELCHYFLDPLAARGWADACSDALM